MRCALFREQPVISAIWSHILRKLQTESESDAMASWVPRQEVNQMEMTKI